MDTIDLALLRQLDTDARSSVAQLAVHAQISRATAYNRLQRLENAGVISGYGVRVDPQAIGMGVTALILLSGGQRHWRDLSEQLSRIPQVKYAAYLAGAFDMAVLVRERSMTALTDLVLTELQELPGVRNTQTLFVMAEVLDRVNAWPSPGSEV